MSTIQWLRGDDGVVVLTMDDPNQSANTMNADFVASLARTVERLEAERDDIAGVVLTSAKKTFFAGGDLRDLIEAGAEIAETSRTVKAQLRRLETLGKPVVAAINGAAMGGGLEIALATHHRIAVDHPKVQIGFPEVQLGLLPGGGGVVRSVRLLGIADALTQLLLKGQRLRADKAKELGVVDALVSSADELVPAAKRWIAANPEAVQAWDVKGHEIPGGTPTNPKLAADLPAYPANLRKQLKGANYPAPHHILAAAVEGAQVDFDSALEIEGRYFVDLVTGQVAKNMIQAFFFDMQRVNGDRDRPEGNEPFRPRKVVVLGAGMMGTGIAAVCGEAGLEVVLKDVTLEAAERGKPPLPSVAATADAADAAGADLVIEAVFEDPAVKAQVFAEIEPHLAEGALLGSNTSTLPITSLAEHVQRPADFIGLHFFSPVEQMPLLEIIRGERTSEETLHRALDLAKLIGKTAIVVNDSRGFFTSRVIITFLNEGIAMLSEGIPAPSIEQASSQAGYPAPVLQLCDELNLRLIRKIREEAKAAGIDADHTASAAAIDRMLDEFDRGGRLAGAGFYEYDEGKRARLWPGLRDAFGGANLEIPFEDLKERLLFIESIEAVKCLDEGVIKSVAGANIGSILGIGFPGWTGGVLQYINGYGLRAFVTRARELAERYGERFEPPASLTEMAESGEGYSDEPVRVTTGT